MHATCSNMNIDVHDNCYVNGELLTALNMDTEAVQAENSISLSTQGCGIFMRWFDTLPCHYVNWHAAATACAGSSTYTCPTRNEWQLTGQSL